MTGLDACKLEYVREFGYLEPKLIPSSFVHALVKFRFSFRSCPKRRLFGTEL